jgi:hypothetical protein
MKQEKIEGEIVLPNSGQVTGRQSTYVALEKIVSWLTT